MTDDEMIAYAKAAAGFHEFLDIPAGSEVEFFNAIAAALAAHQWQPIETAPRDGEAILLCTTGSIPWIGHWVEHYQSGYNAHKFASDVLSQRSGATHWMPLPTVPTTTLEMKE